MALREILARFGFQVDRKGLAAADKGITGVVGKLRTFGAVIAGSAVVRGISNFVGDIVDAGDALGKTATQLGLSSDQLQAWQAAAGFAGVEGNKFNQSLRILQKNALQATQGSKTFADAFKQLGVDLEGSNGQLKTGDQLMREVGLSLNNLENSTEKVALAQILMGRTGAALLPLFKDGEKGLDSALGALERFGGGLTKDLIPLAEAAQDRFAEFNLATTSLKSRLAVAFLPILNQVVLGLSKFGAWIAKATDGTNFFQAALVVLGAVLAKIAIAKFGGSLLALGKAALIPLLKIALLVLLVEDLITLFKGGKSVIGEFLDKLFGKGTAKNVVKAIKGITDAIAEGDWEKAMKKAADALDALGKSIVEFFSGESTGPVAEFFSQVGAMIVAFFVEDIPEGLSQAGFVIVKGVVDLVKGIGETVSDWAQAAADLASALIDGLVEGIKNGAKAVVEAISGVAKDAISAAKKLLKIKSPSAVASEEIGMPLAEGMFNVREAMRAASAFASATRTALPVAPAYASAPARGGGGAALPRGGVVFQSKVDLSVSGGVPSDPQIQKLRQGLRSELTDNRRATLAALTQTVEAT